jgi:hypothetical protein
MMKVSFKQSSKNPKDTKLFLDDKDITNSCRSFKFNASPDYISTVVLELFPSEIEIESESFKLTTDDFTFQDMMDAFVSEASTYIKNNAKIKVVKGEE